MTVAYPLSWPPGWPRTPPHKQGKSRFKATFETSRIRLFYELRILGARQVVLSTDVALRNDGFPYASASRRINDPGAAVYFMLHGKPLTMARDLYYDVGSNIHSLALAIGHLRGLERHGGASMMERAFSGFLSIEPPGGIKKNWWDILEVRSDASRDVIEAHFRRLARDRHPDNGGSHELMSELNLARDAALAQGQ